MFQHASSLFEVTFQYLSLFGVCPNSLRDDAIPWTKKVSTAVLAIYPTHYFVSLIIASYQKFIDITAFILVVGTIFEWINFLVAVLTPLYTGKYLVKFFQITEEAQQTISSLDISQPVVPSRSVQQFYVYVCGILPLLLTAIVYSPTLTFYYVLAIFFLHAATFGTLIKLKMMLLLLENKFKILNRHLKEVSDQTKGIVPKGEINVDDFIFKLHNIKNISSKPKDDSSGITVDKIQKFNKAHFQLCDAHTTLSSMFSLIGLIMTLTVSYVFLKAFILTDNESDVIINIHFYGCSFFTMILFIAVLTSATNVKNNAMKTGYLIHELLCKAHPAEVEEELQLFSHILMHRKIGISAENFFILDLKLLTKMVCTLAPLIMIMVQRKKRATEA